MRIDTRFRHALRALAKSAIALAVVAVVGITVLGKSPPEGEAGGVVEEAAADIWTDRFAPKSDHRKFVEMLGEQGLEKPREYTWNDNQVYFSTAVTGESPREVLRRFQRALVRKGLNERVHTSLPQIDLKGASLSELESGNATRSERTKAAFQARGIFRFYDDMFGGGAVPVEITGERVAMGGVSTAGGAESAMDVLKEHADTLRDHEGQTLKPTDRNVRKMLNGKNLMSMIESVRYIDAWKDGKHTRITSVWTSQDVDLDELRSDQDEVTAGLVQNANDDPVPTCPGCENLMRFAGENGEQYVANAFDAGDMGAKGVRTFYKNSLRERGWQQIESSRVLEVAARKGIAPDSHRRSMRFARGSEFMTVVPVRDDRTGDTLVEIIKSP